MEVVIEAMDVEQAMAMMEDIEAEVEGDSDSHK